MSNLRWTMLFLLGSAVMALALALAFTQRHETRRAAGFGNAAFGPDETQKIEIRRPDAPALILARTPAGEWQVTAPITAAADAVAVQRLMDAFLSTPPGDRLSEREILEMGRAPRDFGFTRKSVQIVFSAGAREAAFFVGALTPSRKGVYVRTEAHAPIVTLPAAAARVPPVEEFRRRTVFSAPLTALVAADFRMPSAPFVKLAREGLSAAWQVVHPVRCAADGGVVNEALDALLALRVEKFVWTLSEVRDVDPETGRAKDSCLAPWGLNAEEGLTVTLWTSPTASETVIFGKPADTNRVYALIHGGTAVATLDARAAALCRAGRRRFLDARLFPGNAPDLASLSVRKGETLYVLTRGTNGLWRLASPVAAPADAAAVAALVGRVMSLKEEDRVAEEAQAAAVSVTLRGAKEASPVAFVSGEVLPDPDDLRAKRILSDLMPEAVTRLSVVSAGHETTVARDAVKGAWNLVCAAAQAPAVEVAVSTAGVARVLSAVTSATARRVANINASAEDFKRAGLDRPAFKLAVDLGGETPRRLSILLGQAAPEGGRYATAGGADAIFVVSRETVAELTVPLTLNALPTTSSKGMEQP